MPTGLSLRQAHSGLDVSAYGARDWVKNLSMIAVRTEQLGKISERNFLAAAAHERISVGDRLLADRRDLITQAHSAIARLSRPRCSPSNSAAAPRSMSENGGGIRDALLRSAATWVCSAVVRLRDQLRVFDDQRQVLRDLVQVGDDGIDRPAGAVSLQHGMERLELGFDLGARRAILGLEQRRLRGRFGPARCAACGLAARSLAVSMVSSRIDSSICRSGDVGADSARKASYFGLSASSFLSRSFASASRHAAMKSLRVEIQQIVGQAVILLVDRGLLAGVAEHPAIALHSFGHVRQLGDELLLKPA